MGRTTGHGSGDTTKRIERALRQCVEWSRAREHRKIVAEVDRQLARLEDPSKHRPPLLIWKAQALLAMGLAERALPPASQSWDLDPSPHACHLTANALEALGELDRAEELLRMGWRLFPEAVHLPVQLAVTLSDQGRHPEALEILDEVPLDQRVPADFQVFLFGMRSNLLAAMGRWAEADDVLRQGIDQHPASDVLSEAHKALTGARKRTRAIKALAASWLEGLVALKGSGAEVDESVTRCTEVNELPEIVALAARRLWRAYLDRHGARPQAPDVWGAALVFSILELDGEEPSMSGLARSVACSPSSTRAVIRRLRQFLGSLDPEFARRAFAAHANPRLDASPRPSSRDVRTAEILRFPIP
jgi:tetratricopeptide (TPR) repeat protein